MKIVYLAAGAAGMYCGSCLHDNTLAAALLSLGEDILLVPTYTPVRTDETNVTLPRVFYGGINVYLQQQWAFFRHTPWFLDRLLDSPRLIEWLTARASTTRAEDLGPLTASMLSGESGRQRKELDKLVHWLASEVQPEVIHLSNAMLCGMAREIARRLRIPIVCTLSGEDIFLEKLPPPYYEQVRELLRDRAQDVSAWVALNHYYADFMSDYLAVPRTRIHVIPHGLQMTGHAPRPARDVAGSSSNRAGHPPRSIGYLARICPEKGLHLLAEAFVALARRQEFADLRLRAAGYLGVADRPYLEEILARITSAGLADRFEYLGEVDRQGKIAFLQSLDVMCLPTIYRESKGLPVLEALANAVPVVVPEHGAFPELIHDTGGGLLCPPNDPIRLAETLARLLQDPAEAARLGAAGRAAVVDRYQAEHMAHKHRELYRALTTAPPAATAAALAQ